MLPSLTTAINSRTAIATSNITRICSGSFIVVRLSSPDSPKGSSPLGDAEGQYHDGKPAEQNPRTEQLLDEIHGETEYIKRAVTDRLTSADTSQIVKRGEISNRK